MLRYNSDLLRHNSASHKTNAWVYLKWYMTNILQKAWDTPRCAK